MMSPIDPGTLDRIGEIADRRSDEIEAERRLPDDLAHALAETGLTRAMAPVETGAAELTIAQLSDAVERLAYHDGSLGWCAMIAATTSLAGGFVQPEVALELYGAAGSWTGGFAAPMGRAQVVAGGLEVTGRWQWGSGGHHCTHLGGGTLIVDGDGRPAPRNDGLGRPFVFFEPGQVELLDTWHVSGLRGTGSIDYTVNGAFVPEGRWFEIGQRPSVDRTLYRFPFYGALAVGVASVALGLARRALDELVTLAANKRPAGSSRLLAERSVTQTDLAEAHGALRSSRLYLDDAIAVCWKEAQHGPPSAAGRVSLRHAATHATLRSAEAVDRCYRAGGGSAIYSHHRLQRLFRDVHVATQHAMVAPRTLEFVGRFGFGLATDLEQI